MQFNEKYDDNIVALYSCSRLHCSGKVDYTYDLCENNMKIQNNFTMNTFSLIEKRSWLFGYIRKFDNILLLWKNSYFVAIAAAVFNVLVLLGRYIKNH